MLQVQGLDVSVEAIEVVRDLNLSVSPGDCVAVLGRNGVGKSTLLTTLAGLRAAQAGVVFLAGQPIAELALRDVARRRAWLAQTQEDAFAATVLDTVLIGRHPWLSRFEWEGEQDVALARRALQEMGLAQLAARNVQTLSGGERQRAALAALQVQEAPLWLLDEPLNHLDIAWQMSVLKHLSARVQQGGAALMVLHDLNLALCSCNRFLLLFGQGRWRLTDRAGLMDLAMISELWGYPAKRVGTDEAYWFVPQ